MENGLVTVVVPIYNVEKYLERCISSIVNQTYRNLEIILVDDGSPDRCPQMCDVWAEKDSRIKVVHKKNAGLGMARNTGIEHATGRYICFFDSDDYVDLNTIQKTVALAENTCADIVVYGLTSVNANGEVIRRFVPQSEEICYRGTAVQEYFLPDLIDNRNKNVKIKDLCLSAWSCMYSVELIQRVNWRFVSERQLISEDSYSIIWLYQHVNCVAVLQEALYFYCENSASLTHSYRADRFEKLKEFYTACFHMAKQAGYKRTVLERISGLFCSFSIAAMKQVVQAELNSRQKRLLIAQIVKDSIFQQALEYVDKGAYTSVRSVLFRAIESKRYLLVYLLVKAHTAKEKLTV